MYTKLINQFALRSGNTEGLLVTDAEHNLYVSNPVVRNAMLSTRMTLRGAEDILRTREINYTFNKTCVQ